jgi:hypothetical protein
MNVSDIVNKVRSAGLSAVQVETVRDDDDDIRPVGDLDAFLTALKSLGVSVVLLEAAELTDEFFYYGDLDEDDEERIDLRDSEKKLRSFESRLGEVGFIRLWAPSSHGHLTHELEDSWWTSLRDLIDSATTAVESTLSEESDRQSTEEAAEWKDVRAKLMVLSEDPSFQKLKTQRAMLQCALERLPELENWDPSDLKGEIRILAAKVEVQRSKKGTRT